MKAGLIYTVNGMPQVHRNSYRVAVGFFYGRLRRFGRDGMLLSAALCIAGVLCGKKLAMLLS